MSHSNRFAMVTQGHEKSRDLISHTSSLSAPTTCLLTTSGLHHFWDITASLTNQQSKPTALKHWKHEFIFHHSRPAVLHRCPCHYWQPHISGHGFARMEQPAVQRHLIDVIDSFQAAPHNRTLSPMFWPGMCLTILLSLYCNMLDSERVLSVVKCSCSPSILWHFNHTRL